MAEQNIRTASIRRGEATVAGKEPNPITLTAKTAAGARTPIDLTGATVVCHRRRESSPEDVSEGELNVDIVSEVGGTVALVLSSAETAALARGPHILQFIITMIGPRVLKIPMRLVVNEGL